jgi:hypothetical protein
VRAQFHAQPGQCQDAHRNNACVDAFAVCRMSFWMPAIRLGHGKSGLSSSFPLCKFPLSLPLSPFRCVLPAECPLLSFTPEWNQWNGRFFPANQPAPNPPKRTEKCRDPLKNFQSCGSACPVGCGRLVASDLPDCTGHCVPG